MKLSKLLALILTITSFSLFYVRQQVKLVEISYQVEKNSKNLSEVLDQSQQLMYNVIALKSPANLEKCLIVKKGQFATPSQWRVVNLAETQSRPNEPMAQRITNIARARLVNFFRFSREAEAGQLK